MASRCCAASRALLSPAVRPCSWSRVPTPNRWNVTGPPVLFPRDCFETLMTWSGRYGTHDLLEREAARVERFASDATIDVDTPDDLQRVRDLLAASRPG